MLLEPKDSARLILLRHPDLANAGRQLALGQRDAELSRRGRQHVVEILRNLASVEIHHIFSSPATHCEATAKALSKDRRLDVEIDERLHDQCLGDWEGHMWSDLREREEAMVRDFFQDYGLVAPPGGETLNDAVDRGLAWWSEHVDSFQDKCVLVVGATPLLSGLAARFLGLSIRRAAALSLPASAFAIFDVYRDGAVLRCWHPNCLSDELP